MLSRINANPNLLPGYHLDVNLAEFENVVVGGALDGPPVDELTDAELQSMHTLFRPGYSYAWCLAAFHTLLATT